MSTAKVLLALVDEKPVVTTVLFEELAQLARARKPVPALPDEARCAIAPVCTFVHA